MAINPGIDVSGNGNNWTTNNINWTGSGSTFDTMTDVPTLTSATTANYCVLNPIDSRTVVSNGNLTSTFQTGLLSSKGTFGVSSGKWYWEATLVVSPSSEEGIGIAIATWSPSGWVGDSSSSFGYWGGAGSGYVTGVKYPGGTTYGAGFTQGAVIGIALDMDAGTLVFYKNGVSQGTFTTGLTGTWMPAVSNQISTSSWSFNFGQQGFLYTPPTGFVALNTFNLPTPSIGATASTQANKYFDAKLYTGNASALTVSGLGFSPDLVWIKPRVSAFQHQWYDTVRGALKRIGSSSTAAESTETETLKTFTSDGFTLGNDVGTNPASAVVAWCWDANGTGVTNTAGSITSTVSANTSAGFSIVTYTGNGSTGATVGHGLGVAPSMVIVKKRSSTGNWITYHIATGVNQYLYLNQTAAAATATPTWGVSSTTVTFQQSFGDYNDSGVTYVMYAFSEVAGYSKFGSYTGNLSTDGTFVYTGFRPAFVMIKRTDSTGFWAMLDDARSPYNVADEALYANASNAESTAQATDFTSNGFKLRTTDSDVNANGSYIYMAFAESPFKYANAR